jgi:hypothetical protein
VTIEQEEQVKSRKEIMEVLEAFDLTASLRAAGELAGCSHHTVALWVARRDAGELPNDGPQRARWTVGSQTAPDERGRSRVSAVG